jgi:hypothetical protein
MNIGLLAQVLAPTLPAAPTVPKVPTLPPVLPGLPPALNTVLPSLLQNAAANRQTGLNVPAGYSKAHVLLAPGPSGQSSLTVHPELRQSPSNLLLIISDALPPAGEVSRAMAKMSTAEQEVVRAASLVLAARWLEDPSLNSSDLSNALQWLLNHGKDFDDAIRAMKLPVQQGSLGTQTVPVPVPMPPKTSAVPPLSRTSVVPTPLRAASTPPSKVAHELARLREASPSVLQFWDPTDPIATLLQNIANCADARDLEQLLETLATAAPETVLWLLGQDAFWAVLEDVIASFSPEDQHLAHLTLQRLRDLATALRIAASAEPPDPRYERPESKVTFLIEIDDEGNFEPIGYVPRVEPGSGYVITVLSLPDQATQIALRLGHGALPPDTVVASRRKFAHLDMLDHVFPESTFDPATGRRTPITFVDEDEATRSIRAAKSGGYFSFNEDGSLTLLTKSGAHNLATERVGTVRVTPPPRPWSDDAPVTLHHDGGAPARELAQLLADATGRDVVLGDPGFPWTHEVVRPRATRGKIVVE